MGDALRRLRAFVVHHVLHLDDTPERIALGVALGFFVAWTPTLGMQMVIYVTLATLFRANKLSGLGPVWITNPLTALPIYYSNWWVGQLVVRQDGQSREDVRAALSAVEAAARDWRQLGEAAFWHDVGVALGELGVALWVGSAVVGTILGVLSYFATRRAVVAYRRRRGHAPAAVEPSGSP